MRAPNVTLDIYIAPNAPPAAPDTAGATGHLAPNFRPGQEANEGSRTFLWDHVLEVSLSTDIRDDYPSAPAQRIFIPHTATPGQGQEFRVVFVEKVTHFHTPRGKSFKRVYLQRQQMPEVLMALTIREVDGTPSYATVTIIEVDQADGFTLSEPNPGQIRLDLDMATLAAALAPSLPAPSLSLNDLTDVTILTPTFPNFIGWDGAHWFNIGIALDMLTDVTCPAPAVNDVLTFNGTTWVNQAPAFTGARVYKSTQTISSGSFVPVEFDNEFFDVGGFHDNATDNERLTIPTGRAGYYRVTAKVCWEDFDGFVQAQLLKNGSTVLTLDAGTNTTSGYFQSFSVNAIAPLAEGDYVEFQVYQETGSDKEIFGGTAMTFLEIEYLGA